MKLTDIYKAMLETADIIVTKDGFLSSIHDKDNEPQPWLLKGKRLALPTDEQLKTLDWEARTIFHPLWEVITHSESPVLEKYRLALMTRINYKLASVMSILLKLASSTDDHKRLNPDQSEFLSKVKTATEGTFERFEKILDRIPDKDMNKFFVSIYLKRNGSVQGERFGRVGVVTSPFYEQLMKYGEPGEDKKPIKDVLGIELRKGDHAALIGMMDFIFPHMKTTGWYNQGSDSKIAPFVEVLMKTALGLIDPINSVIELFDGILPAEEMKIQTDWEPIFQNLQAYQGEIRSVPMQAGNEGSSIPTPQAKAEPAPAPAPAQAWPQAQFGAPPVAAPQQPTPAPAPQRTASGKTDFASVVRGNPTLMQGMGYQQQGYAVPAPMPPVGYMPPGSQPAYGYGQPTQPAYGYGQPVQPVYGQPMPQQQPAVYGYQPGGGQQPYYPQQPQYGGVQTTI